MSNQIAISVDRLGKKYVLNHQRERERYVALRDVVTRKVRGLFRSRPKFGASGSRGRGNTTEEFWALKDVSFEVPQGDVVGIVGRNGAGKSTLLKVLSRITEPTEGRVALRGRVASLLEVGTGFHPELTGRENIYLNGAILGMTRIEIRRKFEEIVDFAEVEKFLDTPVKRYSSGMYVRLAFAVAAHIEPEVLVVDEVLAVGDAEFQKKCLGKMSDVAKGGRTVLFVSHNMAAVEALCPRSIHLAAGTVVADGSTTEVVRAYLDRYSDDKTQGQHRATVVQEGLVLNTVIHSPGTIRSGSAAQIELRFHAEAAGQLRECALLIFNAKGYRVAVIDPRESGAVPFRFGSGAFVVSARIAALPLVEGEYSIGVYLATDDFADDILDLDHFTVLAANRTAEFSPYDASVRGVVVLNASTSVAVNEPLLTVG